MDFQELIDRDITVTIKARDLKAFAIEFAIELAKRRKQQSAREEQALLTRAEVCRMVRKTTSTIVRWAKVGYLKPVYIGGRAMYRYSDVKALMDRE